jgi:hypothetical protein
MTHNGTNHMPKPEPYWIALGIVVWSMAVALGPKRRRMFLDAMEALTEEHVSRRRVIAFRPLNARSRNLPQATLIAAAYLRRLVEGLKAVFK